MKTYITTGPEGYKAREYTSWTCDKCGYIVGKRCKQFNIAVLTFYCVDKEIDLCENCCDELIHKDAAEMFQGEEE
jgi:hypothetical protein